MTPQVTQLPSREIMLAKLKDVDTDRYTAERLHPLICDKLAGKQLGAPEIAKRLAEAIRQYATSLGNPNTAETQRLISMQNKRAPDYIDAIVTDDIFRIATRTVWQFSFGEG